MFLLPNYKSIQFYAIKFDEFSTLYGIFSQKTQNLIQSNVDKVFTYRSQQCLAGCISWAHNLCFMAFRFTRLPIICTMLLFFWWANWVRPTKLSKAITVGQMIFINNCVRTLIDFTKLFHEIHFASKLIRIIKWKPIFVGVRCKSK